MKEKKKPRNHVKMYADDDFIEQLRLQAIEEGLSRSAYIFTTMKKTMKRSNK